MTITRPSGWRALVGASAFAMPLAASVASANRLPVSCWISLALFPACLAAIIDTHWMRLPDELLAITACVVCLAAVAASQPEALLAAGVTGGSVLVLHLVNPVWFGFGDVKLAAVLGGVVGLIDWRLGVWTLAGAALVGLILASVRWRTAIAFGPALVVTAAAAMAVDTMSRGAWS